MIDTTETIDPLGRDPETGKLTNPISIDIHHAGAPLPTLVYCRNWNAARTFLASAEFRAIADDVSFVTITNREAM